MITSDRIDSFLKEHRRQHPHFNVAPRFTPGSPALVNRETATRVAMEEDGAYTHAQDGRYGDQLRAIADDRGLLGIVELRAETKKGWDVLDLLTGERFTRAFPKS